MAVVALNSTTAATAPTAFHGSVTDHGDTNSSAATGTTDTQVLQGGHRAKVDAGAEPLLVDTATGHRHQGHHQQQHHGVDTADGNQSACACGKDGSHAEHERDCPTPGEALAEEHCGKHRGDHRIHRDDHRSQHRGSTV